MELNRSWIESLRLLVPNMMLPATKSLLSTKQNTKVEAVERLQQLNHVCFGGLKMAFGRC